MTSEDWKYVENRLSIPYGNCRLICDGYKVSLHVHAIKKLTFGVVVYVNGKMDFNWLQEDCPERTRFMRRIEKPLYTPSQQKAEKQLARLLKRASHHDKRYIVWMPYWTNATALRRHFCKHIQDIQLVRDDV